MEEIKIGKDLKTRIESYIKGGLNYTQIAVIENIDIWTVMAIDRGNGNTVNFEENLAGVMSVLEKDELTTLRLAKQIAQSYIVDPKYFVTSVKDNPVNIYDNKKCFNCGSTKDLVWHAVDDNPDNKLVSNIEHICNDCLNRLTSILTPTMSVTSTFKFDSAHFIPNHNKKCKFIHGHSYKLEVTVKRYLNQNNMVIDFGVLKEIVNRNIVDVLDHNFLNNFMAFPSSEVIILWIWQQLQYELKGLERLRLYETETNYSELTKYDLLPFCEYVEPSELDNGLVTQYTNKQGVVKYLNKVNRENLYHKLDYEVK